MAKKHKRDTIKLKSTEKESHFIYYVKKNKINTPDRLELMKYDPTVRKHVIFKESK